ncbi:response regulator transcription factor [Paracoccus sp. (in: a-proteobacteria)]|uniref:helix-turn-helix transcriptional regulator n=1 Tax=Paracoccus sp. TaxID=267 RepID=UPI0028AC3B3D|nr:response regulator transcription factor [Paracoccus sp. (in: a-proteobacteria)]
MSIASCDGVASEILVLPGQPARRTAEVLLIGTQCNFSHNLIAATSQELGHITVAAAPSFHDFRSLAELTHEQPTLLVLDEPTMRGLTKDDRTYLLGLAEVALAVAFCTGAFGRACYEDEELRQRMTSIFPLNCRLDVWLSVIKLVAHGGNYILPEIISPAGIVAPVPATDELGLTRRQHDVLRLVADGQSNKRIASALGLSVHTVKLHLRNANLRLGAHNRTEAAMRYRTLRS